VSAPVARVTRRYRFAAAHRLHSGALSDEKNREVFGKCNNPFGHGHNYTVDVAIRGPIDSVSGRVVEPAAIDDLMLRQILEPLDQANMNTDVPEFRENVPTTENLALLIEERLRLHWPSTFPQGGPALDYIRVHETRNNSFQTAKR
jgi:6-pyruvoyltetrahydropterin/6-carboxytetrahydropterin synthase